MTVSPNRMTRSDTGLFVLCLVAVMAFAYPLAAQFSKNDSLFVGKRGNVVRDRKISVFNLGNEKWNYYYAIYFRTAAQPAWRKTGLTGRHIEPCFRKNDAAMALFRQYQRDKKTSYVLLAASITFLTGWAFY